MLKKILIFLSVFPLLFHAPYLYSAWRGSRLDQWDWIYYILAIPALFFAARSEKMEKYDYTALLLIVPSFFITMLTPWHHINILGVAFAVGLIFGMIWLAGSWKFAYRLMPAMVILVLGTPSSSYQISLLLMCPVWMAWMIKFLIAVLCFLWILCNKRYQWHLTKQTLLFCGACLVTSLLLLHMKELYFEGKSFIPVFTNRTGEFFGRSIMPDGNTRRFFATSTVRQYRYTRNNTDVSVLAVQCGDNIHEIHPASHCLRTSMWTVDSETLHYLQNNFAVTEIDARKGGTRLLIWVWFSDDAFSTPSFLGFRRHFKAGRRYFTYQISTEIRTDIDKSRSVLMDFVKSLKHEEVKQ
jgi:hypothetical protein